MIVVITGTARGMGRLYAERVVAEGAAKVVLLDVDIEVLEATAAELRAIGGIVFPFVVDLSSREDIVAVAERVRAEVGYPDVAINNAGIIRSSMFWEHDPVRDGVTPHISSLCFGPTSEERQLGCGRTFLSIKLR